MSRDPGTTPDPSVLTHAGKPAASDIASHVLIEPEALIERVRQAYIAGCEAVHENYQPDPDPDFGEASYDYVASLDFTEDTRPARGAAASTELYSALRGLMLALRDEGHPAGVRMIGAAKDARAALALAALGPSAQDTSARSDRTREEP
jgi:hypothetical protein